MKATKIELNKNVNTEIFRIDYEDIKDKKIDESITLKCRNVFNKPGIVVVDNILEEEVLKNLQSSLSQKKRKFKSKFIDETKLNHEIITSKLKAARKISSFTSDLFGYNTPCTEFGLRNMICSKEPMHYDSFFLEDGLTPLMSITNIDFDYRLWNVGYHFEELLQKKQIEIEKLLKNDERNISTSIKLRENRDLNLGKNIFHKISFAPNSIWFTNPKIVCHQLVYGGGILINTWNLKNLPSKSQDALLREYGYTNTADQALRANEKNLFKRFSNKLGFKLKTLFR